VDHELPVSMIIKMKKYVQILGEVKRPGTVIHIIPTVPERWREIDNILAGGTSGISQVREDIRKKSRKKD